MAPQLDELDEMLLGEEHHQKAAGKTNTKHDSTQKGADDDCSNPLIATAGTLVRVDHSGNEIAEQQVSHYLSTYISSFALQYLFPLTASFIISLAVLLS